MFTAPGPVNVHGPGPINVHGPGPINVHGPWTHKCSRVPEPWRKEWNSAWRRVQEKRGKEMGWAGEGNLGFRGMRKDERKRVGEEREGEERK